MIMLYKYFEIDYIYDFTSYTSKSPIYNSIINTISILYRQEIINLYSIDNGIINKKK